MDRLAIQKIQREIDDDMLDHNQQHDLCNDCLQRGYKLGAQIHHDARTACGKRVMDAHTRIGAPLDKMLASVAD